MLKTRKQKQKRGVLSFAVDQHIGRGHAIEPENARVGDLLLMWEIRRLYWGFTDYCKRNVTRTLRTQNTIFREKALVLVKHLTLILAEIANAPKRYIL